MSSLGPEAVTTTAQEFALVASQLEWLETYLRSHPPGDADERLGDSLNALAVARALVLELTSIGSQEETPLSADVAQSI